MMSVLVARLPVGSLVNEYCMDLKMMQLDGPVHKAPVACGGSATRERERERDFLTWVSTAKSCPGSGISA